MDLLNVLVVGLLLGGIYSLVSIGLNLIFGVIRVVNFAQGELVMLAMYATFAAYNVLHLDPYVAVIIVCPLMFVLGVVVQRFILQPLQNEPMMQIFATFGLLIVAQNTILAVTRGAALSIDTKLSSVTISVGAMQLSLVRVVALFAASSW
jgi:branched-chain amino acid transport system permease protein